MLMSSYSYKLLHYVKPNDKIFKWNELMAEYAQEDNNGRSQLILSSKVFKSFTTNSLDKVGQFIQLVSSYIEIYMYSQQNLRTAMNFLK